jgi:biopolymer transport protein ExbD
MANLKKTPGINAASMADISFIILIFFLMVTTMGSEFGMIRQLPPWVDPKDQTNEQVNARNVFMVNVNLHNNLLVEKEYREITELRTMCKDFFNLANSGVSYPEKVQKELPLLGTMTVNRTAVVSLKNDRGTSYKTYMQVQNELTAAITELRNEFCMQKFGKLFEECTQEQQDVVSQDVYPMSISEAEPENQSNT